MTRGYLTGKSLRTPAVGDSWGFTLSICQILAIILEPEMLGSPSNPSNQIGSPTHMIA